MNIAAVLRQRALDSGDLAALIESETSIGFAELDRLAAAVAAQLHAAGIRARDRVIVLYPMSITLYATLVGLWRLGAVAVFVDPSAGHDHLERCCDMVSPRAFAASRGAHLIRLTSPAIRSVPLKISLGQWTPGARTVSVTEAGEHLDTICAVEGDAPALITFTSGSTGQPKAAVRSHGFLRAQHRVLAEDLHLVRGQRDLAALPIFVLANLASAVTSIIPDADLRYPGEIAPARLLRQIRRFRPTRVAASPALLERLARHAEWHRESLPEFREIYTGGAPVFPRVLRQLQALAPEATVVAVYGSTEAEPIARVSWTEIRREDLAAMASGAGLLVGKPVSAIDLRILGDRWGVPIPPLSTAAFAARSLPPNRAGEIVVAGDHVLQGYLGGIGNAETKFLVDERVWHRTGDAGYLDREGRLWLLGRSAATLEDEHGTIHPFAVECAADSLPAVRRAALVRLEGRRVLVVETDAEPLDRVREELQAKLAWAHLGRVIFVETIPVDRRHNAKVDYPALAAMLKQLRTP